MWEFLRKCHYSVTQKLTTKACFDGGGEGGNGIIDLLIFLEKPGRKPRKPRRSKGKHSVQTFVISRSPVRVRPAAPDRLCKKDAAPKNPGFTWVFRISGGKKEKGFSVDAKPLFQPTGRTRTAEWAVFAAKSHTSKTLFFRGFWTAILSPPGTAGSRSRQTAGGCFLLKLPTGCITRWMI